ncbi:MAG: Gfo/Idh/MocA family oxidoreductase [Lentisphaeria bacterium]|jgi:predicted dehydrogenase|nr:Gfo/Idh/MocA family oxidoreductase [Lentisphaeria bacterium]
MKTYRFGIIGCGLMGREFGSAAARWCHLTGLDFRPEIVAVCDANPAMMGWFQENFPSVGQATTDYHELLANPAVDCVYCAVPHNLHERFYCDIVRAGKHLLGEKPFGIDLAANTAINACLAEHPEVFVRCSSEFPFFPPMQRLGRMIEERAFGRIIEVNSGFLHSSDLNPEKTINWKRMVAVNGEYGCLGDLGMHPCHMPFKAGWYPRNVRAILSNIVAQRPDKTGKLVPCETWDNGTLLCEAADPETGDVFPLTIKTQRIAPGETDTWYFEVKGTLGCGRWTSSNPRRIELLRYTVGGEQAWQRIDMGWEAAFPGITGGIFEFGFTDCIQQMWAAFLHELHHGQPKSRFAACVTPAEVAATHRLFTAALRSQAQSTTETVGK